MKVIFYIHLFVYILSSCARSEGSQQELPDCKDIMQVESMLNAIDTVTIDVSHLQYDFRFISAYWNDTISLVFGLDAGKNTIEVFDLLSSSHLISIEFEHEGVNALTVSDFYVHNLDSIFVLDDTNYRLGLVNIQNEWTIHHRLPFNEKVGYIESSIDSRLFYNRLSKHLLISAVPALPLHDPKSSDLPYLVIFDLQTMSDIGVAGKYPSGYYQHQAFTPFNKMDYSIMQAVSTSSVIMHYKHAPYLVEFDYLKDSILDYRCMKSNYVPEYLPDYEGGPYEYLDLVDYHTTTPGYFLGFYHQGLKKYFIPVKHGQKLYSGTLKNTYHTVNWSIMVIDEHQDTVYEQFFEAGLENYKMVIPTPEGIAVALENPYHDDNIEDELSFKHYELH